MFIFNYKLLVPVKDALICLISYLAENNYSTFFFADITFTHPLDISDKWEILSFVTTKIRVRVLLGWVLATHCSWFGRPAGQYGGGDLFLIPARITH